MTMDINTDKTSMNRAMRYRTIINRCLFATPMLLARLGMAGITADDAPLRRTHTMLSLANLTQQILSRKSAIVMCLLFLNMLGAGSATAAITATLARADGTSNTDANSYTVAAFTPAANNLVLIWITNTRDSSPSTPTITGNNLTWVQVATVTWGTTGSPTARTTLFRAMGSAPNDATTTIDFGGVTQTGVSASFVQFSGVNTSGTNGSGAVVQSVTGRTDSATAAAGLSITLAALGNVVNATAGGFSNLVDSATSISAGSGYTASGGNSHNMPNTSIRSEWKTTGSTTVNVTQSTTSHIGGIAVEIKAASTTLGNGTDPGNSSIAPGAAATNAGAFSFQTSNGTDTINDATVTLAAGSSGGLSLVEITNAAGTTVYGSVANPASDTPLITLSTNTLTATTTLTEYRIRVTPKSHANMPAPAGASYAVTARISAFTSANTNAKEGTDAAGTTVTIDNLSTANVTATTATAGNTQVSLAWTNPADGDLHSIVVLRRATSAVADVPVEGSTYTVGNTIGVSTVACVVAVAGTSCTDTGLTNGTAYHYRIFARDSSGNYSATGVVPSGSPATPVVTTLGNGTDPGNASLAPGGAATMADAFSFQTSSSTDIITAATVTLATGTSGGLSLVEITNVDGTTVYGSAANPASDTPAITLSTNTLTATTTSTEYRIRVTPKSHANMPAPAGSTYSVTARISAFTSTNAQAGSDTAGTTVTIDNLSPGNVSAASATPSSTQVALAWTNPVDADLHSIIVLRRTVSVVTDTPVEGTTYVVGNAIGSSTVACVVASPTATCADTGLTNGTAYYYKIFTKDSNGNYSTTGVVPAGSPATPNITTILDNGTDPGNSSLAPGGAATNTGAFSFQTSSGTDVITAATVTLAAGTSAGLSLVEITNVAGTTVYGSVTNPGSDTPAITLSTNTLTVTTSLTEYRIRVTPKSHANMPAPAGASYAVTARISAFTSTNAQTGSDTASTTVTIDNLSPGNVTAATATTGDAQVSLAWTNPVDADFHSVIVLRKTGDAVADVPVEGSTYTVGNTIGTATVACVVAVAGTSCTDTGLTNSTAYHYKIFAKDSNGNYSASGVVPTGSPATPTLADVTPPANVINLNVIASTATTVDLAWTSPGDDANVGTATSYDLRYSTSPITTGNWASATQAVGEPTPLVAGSSQSFSVTGLAAATTYYFVMTSSDEIPNTSTLSDSAVGTTGGASGSVNYYAKRSNGISIASGITSNSGSCGTDPTAYYIEELSKNISDMCVTANAYRWEQLAAGSYSDHYFNTAYVANTTVTGVSYQVTIRDGGTLGFQLFYVTSGGAKTYLGTEVTRSNSDTTTNNYILNLSGQSGTIPTGAKLGFRTRGISVSPSLRIYVGNLDNRTSNISGHLIVNEAVGSSDTTAPASVTLSTGTITNNSVLLNWVSPGDDNNTGTAQSYDIRYSTAAITADNWASATQVGGEPTPLVAGTAQSYTVTGLAANTLYYFAIKTGDETPNWSAVSNSPSATTYDPPVGGFSVDNVIPATQISQTTNGSGIVTINWKGRDNQANNVTLKTFQYSVDGGATWNAPTNGDASAALSATWSNNGGSGWITATTLAAAPVNSFTFNTKHADVSGLNGVEQNDVRVRFLLRDATMDSLSFVTSADFRVDALAPTATIGSAIYDAANDLLTITGANFTTIAAASTDIKTYVDWSKFVWDINGDNATTTDISFVLGDITSLIITNDTTLTLQFSAAKGIAIEATAGYSTTGGVDTLDVAAGFARDDYGNAATTDAVANGPLVTTSISGILYDTDRTTSLGFGMTVRLLINGTSMGTTTTDGSGRYTFWNNVSAGNAILVYIDNGASTAVSATVTANASLSDFDLYASHLVARHDNGGALSNANLESAKGAYVDTDIVYSVTGSALTVSGSATRLHIPAGKSFTPAGNITTPAMSNLGTFAGGSGAITINGNLSNSGTYTASSATTSVSANFSNSGTFTAAGGTVLLNGTNQNISGTTTFFNLTKTVATADTLFFSAGSTTTVTGSSTLQGASGQPLSLLSLTPGSRWNFNIGSSATKSFSFLNVIDSDASGSDAAKKPLIAQPSNSTDSGNNVDWFGLPSIMVIKSSTLISDPVNGTTSPLHIPGAILNYQILTTNSGNGSPDTNTVVVTDALDSSKLEFDVTTGITFTANTSGLTLGTVSYAHTATPTIYTYTPTGPYDANVAGIKITTSGTFASAGASFTLNFRVRIK